MTKPRLRRVFALAPVLAMLSLLLWAAGPGPANAGSVNTGVPADTLTIKVGYFGGPYYTKKVYTVSDLEAMPQVKQAYTFIDSMPAVCLDSAIGVKLTDLLEDAGIDVNSVELFYFYATDVKKGWYQSLPKSFLLDTKRYYYPNLPAHWDYDEQMSVPGAVYGAIEVEPVIAIHDNWQRFATVPDFTVMSDDTRFRLVFGQVDTSTCTASRSAKWVHAIEVMLGGTPPAGVTLDQDLANIKVGSSVQLTATVAPDDATDKSVIWSSSDTGVATVDEHGLVTVVGPGTATITVSTVVGEMTATCIVNGPNPEGDQSAAPAGAGSSNNGGPEDPAGPLSGMRYLAEKEAAAGQEKSNIFSEQSGSQHWRVFEMSADAVPLQRQEEPNSLEIYEVVIFLVLFLFGSVKKYREYTREVAR